MTELQGGRVASPKSHKDKSPPPERPSFFRAIPSTGWGHNLRLGLSALFLALIGFISYQLTGGQAGAIFIIAAAVIGGYMALNIGG